MHFRDAVTGPILSLTTDNMCIITFPGFWWLCQMIQMQELLLTVSVASVDSPSSVGSHSIHRS